MTSNCLEPGALLLEFRRSGDPSVLASLFERIAPMLLRMATKLAVPGVQPEDLVQGTFMRAIQLAERYASNRPLVPWLHGIMRLVAREEARKWRRREIRDAASVPASPHELAERAEALAAVCDGIAALSEPYRSVVRQSLMFGHSLREISASQSIPLGTVKSRMSRGMQQLRQALPKSLGVAVAACVAQPVLASARQHVLAHARDRIGTVRGSGGAAVDGGIIRRVALVASSLLLVLVAWWTVSGGAPLTLGPALEQASDAAGPSTAFVHLSTKTAAAERKPAASIRYSVRGRVVDLSAEQQLWSEARVEAYLPTNGGLLPRRAGLATHYRSPEIVGRALQLVATETPSAVAKIAPDGRFTLPTTANRAWLVLKHPFCAFSSPKPWSAVPDGDDLGVLPVYTGGRVTGRIAGAPEGTLVTLRVDPRSMRASGVGAMSLAYHGGQKQVRTNVDGGFAFDAVWSCTELELWTTVSGRSLAARLRGPAPRCSVEATLAPVEPAALQVRVVGDRMRAGADSRTEGLVVRLFDARSQCPRLQGEVKLAGGGLAVFEGVLPGRYRVAVVGRGCVEATKVCDLISGWQSVVIHTEVGERHCGTVLDAMGRALVGARVTARADIGMMGQLLGAVAATQNVVAPAGEGDRPKRVLAQGVTDARGQFALRVADPVTSFLVEPPAARSDLGALCVSAIAEPVTLPCRSRMRVRCTVDQGLDLPAQLRASWSVDGFGGALSSALVVLDAAGWMEVPPRPLGANLLVLEAYSAAARIPLCDKCGCEVPSEVCLRRRLAPLLVKVVGPDGAPAAGASVRWSVGRFLQSLQGSVVADEVGQVRLPVPAGDLVSVSARLGKLLGKVSVDEPMASVVLRLHEGARIVGRASPGAWGMMMCEASPLPNFARADEAGLFRFDHLEPGRYGVGLAQAGGGGGFESVCLAAGETAEVILRDGVGELEAFELHVAGIDHDEELFVVVNPGGAGAPFVAKLENGLARVELRIPAELRVTDRDGVAIGPLMRVGAGVQNPLSMEIPANMLSVAVDGVGRTAMGSVRSIDGNAEWHVPVGPDDRFVFRGLPAGSYQVRVIGECVASAKIDVHPGAQQAVLVGGDRVPVHVVVDGKFGGWLEVTDVIWRRAHPGTEIRDGCATLLLPPGDYRLRVSGSRGDPTAIHVAAGDAPLVHVAGCR